MKVTTNFAGQALNFVPMLLGVFGLVCVLATVAIVAFVLDGSALREERADLAHRLSQLEGRRAQIEKVALPPAHDLAKMRDRVAAINRIAGARGGGLMGLITKLEMLLPDPVYLVDLHHRAETGEITITAESNSGEALAQFLLRLQKEEDFAEVLLARQAQRSGRDGRVQFELRIRERRDGKNPSAA